MRNQVGQNIRAARERCGLEQRELAEKVFGKAERSSYISDVESGKAGNVTVERLAEFAKALNRDPCNLLVTTNSKNGVA